MFSLSLDYDQGNTVTVRGYADQWRWSRGKVERFFCEIGVEITYPQNTTDLRNQRGHIMMPNPSQKRTNNGQIKAIDSKWLSREADIKRANDEPKTGQSQGTTIKPKPKPTSIPTIEEVKTYCLERNKGVDPQRWFDFYEAKGWMIGKNSMKDWKAAVRTWEKGAEPAPQPQALPDNSYMNDPAYQGGNYAA